MAIDFGLLDSAPSELRERCRFVNKARLQQSRSIGVHEPNGQSGFDEMQPADPGFVLYWLHHSMRATENPALNMACWIANQCNQPLIVYQELNDSEPYASDRHHRFVLEGARDLQSQLQKKGISYHFHLQRPGFQEGYRLPLAKAASCVITDEMPTEPYRGWVEQLAAELNSPCVAVDSACVVSYHVVGRSYERAFQFREATKTKYSERVSGQGLEIDLVEKSLVGLPKIEGCVDLQTTVFDELIALCDIDHSIAPTPDTIGGSAAGYERWDQFREQSLIRYAKDRNDPLRDGTSRLSAYLHYGMVAPTRIAREAAASASQGSEKYLDELLIWRELAYGYCFYNPNHGDWESLPEWAKETLDQHASDTRPTTFTWEDLAWAKTGDSIWDSAQKSLLLNGELHNNVRMTWGKAILQWTESPQQAFKLAIELNHRFALDGRDPASYGGLLWCFGLFDRPFEPARPIFGTVRERSTDQHAKRLDAEKYQSKVMSSAAKKASRFAVIGAGLSGVIAARILKDYGYEVTIFEKSRGVGGRMATRRGEGELRFDHGAQYFTARDPRFMRYVQSWIAKGIVSAWQANVVRLSAGTVKSTFKSDERFVGNPGMNSVAKHVAKELEVVTQTRVSELVRTDGRWKLLADTGSELGEFDGVISSAPAQQSLELLDKHVGFGETLRQATMSGCWAVMLALEQSLNLPFDAAFCDDSILSWIAKNSTKPGRAATPETWVLHASPCWSQIQIDLEPDVAKSRLLEAFWEVTQSRKQIPETATVHRWRFALPENSLTQQSLYDTDSQIGVCGDWCAGARVEAAFLSGLSIAGRVLASRSGTEKWVQHTLNF